MTYIGIDPGKSGALAIINGDEVKIFPFDKQTYVEELLKVDETGAICCLEKVHAMPKNGAVAMFTFGENFGWIQGVLDAYKIPYDIVEPRKWKSEYTLNSDKQKSIDVAHRLFPNVSLRKTEKCRTDDDGMAESLLMALFAKRRLGR